VTTLQSISQDLEPDPGMSPSDLASQDHTTTISDYTTILAEHIVLDQDWCWYRLWYPDEVITFYNAGHPVVRRIVLTLYEINTEPPRLPQPAPQVSINSLYSFDRYPNSELNAQPTVISGNIGFPNMNSVTRTSSSGPTNCMDMDSPT
jgi:hypothetical protein